MAKKSEMKGEFELEELKHINHMKEIETETEGKKRIELLRFDHQMQLQRIKTAEIQKSQMRKQRSYDKSY